MCDEDKSVEIQAFEKLIKDLEVLISNIKICSMEEKKGNK